jgi:hypothetical protein
MDAVLVIWSVTLAIVVLVIVPVAVMLLDRALRAARAIQAYAEEMLAAGAGIAGNTAAISALNATTATAGAMVQTAAALEAHSADIAATLSRRAGGGGG